MHITFPTPGLSKSAPAAKPASIKLPKALQVFSYYRSRIQPSLSLSRAVQNSSLTRGWDARSSLLQTIAHSPRTGATLGIPTLHVRANLQARVRDISLVPPPSRDTSHRSSRDSGRNGAASTAASGYKRPVQRHSTLVQTLSLSLHERPLDTRRPRGRRRFFVPMRANYAIGGCERWREEKVRIMCV